MAKITQVNNGDTGLVARQKINEAMKTAEVGAWLSGDGTASNPLKAVQANPFQYKFQNDSTEGNPPSGFFRRNDIGTELYISNTNQLGDNISSHLMKLKTGASIFIKEVVGLGKITATLTADAIQQTGYVKLLISEDQPYSIFIANSLCFADVVNIGGGGGVAGDYERIFFRSLSPDYGVVFRSFNYKVTVKTDYGGVITLTKSDDSPYTLGDTITAGDYLKATADTLLARTVLTVTPA